MWTAETEYLGHSKLLVRGPKVKRSQQGGQCGGKSMCRGEVRERPESLGSHGKEFGFHSKCFGSH